MGGLLADISVVHMQATIPDGTATTGAIELEYGQSVVGVYKPEMDTSTEFNFEVSHDGVTYVALEDGAGVEYALPFDNSIASYAPISDLTLFAGVRFLKITVADNQTGDKALQVAVRPLS